MTTVIYKYFCDNFGSIDNNSHNTEFVKKYESYTAKELKKKTSRKRFLRFVQIKHSISQTGFQHSLLRKHHLILTPRPMKNY